MQFARLNDTGDIVFNLVLGFWFGFTAPSRDNEFRPRLQSMDDELVGKKYRNTTLPISNFPGRYSDLVVRIHTFVLEELPTSATDKVSQKR